MELKLRNIKGTKEYMPEEQYVRNKIRKVLEDVFQRYGYLPLDTPELCYYEVLASKYAGGSEILKEIYKLKDQGDRSLGLRYDLTVPFAKVIGMNPDIRLPFKRYEIGKVFRDGPVKLGRNREFVQCDVDVAGIKSMLAEAELVSMAFEVFEKLGLEVYVSYNNRKLLSGIIAASNISSEMTNDVILTVDKIEKIGAEGVQKELSENGLSQEMIINLFDAMKSAKSNLDDYIKSNSCNELVVQGGAELRELTSYLSSLGIADKVRFNPFLARGLDIYTGTVYETFLTDGSITSSVAGGGRYDKIIGSFIDNGKEYPAVGISFGLDVIYAALTLKGIGSCCSPIDLLIIPLGTEVKALQLTQQLRKAGVSAEMEMTGRKLKKSLDFANKAGITYVAILGESELEAGCIKLKNMLTGQEELIQFEKLIDRLKDRSVKQYNAGIH